MSSRRSARLRTKETKEPVEVQQPKSVEVARNKKDSKAREGHTHGRTGPKKRVTGSALDMANKPPSQAQFSPTNDALSSLPPELLYMILDNVRR
jgi:hypothetical protein